VLKLLWTRETADFNGRFYQLHGAISEPKPVQKPHPPLWIGGSGERKTLRVAARHADVWNIPGGDPAEAARLSGVLDDHCAAVGRDPRTIRRSVGVRYFPEAPERTLETARAMIERGFTELLLTVIGDDPARQVAAAAALLPELRR
jgi:alkanesulfonate monooxygenase SsuD/methylene tetrahydromethanopterin reductase-like flavin-dependent oxidoreductase (luciferase family)